MYELIKLTEHDHYLDCPAKIGLVLVGEREVIAIDSGSDKDAGKKVYRVLEDKGWKLQAIFNTHSHADHIGGNRFLQDKTGCPIYAAGLEAVYANSPLLEPMTLNGGRPHRDLQHKFLLARESTVQPLSPAVLPKGMTLLPLPGHSFDMVGFLTADGTAYIADSVSSAETLSKYGVGYLWDYAAALQTLAYLQTISARRFVPAHALVCEDVTELAELNRQALLEVRERLLAFCAEPLCFEDLLENIFDDYALTMNAQQYALIGSTVRSYLSSLYDEGALRYSFDGNRMLWQTAAD